jgi:hypothetical protein
MRTIAEQPRVAPRGRGWPNWVRLLEKRLINHAPMEAVAYRLCLLRGRRNWRYPPADHPSLRWNGRRRLDGVFSLVPFEPPIVPVTDVYRILFYDFRGAELITPPAFTAGVDLYPMPARKIEIFDGEAE